MSLPDTSYLANIRLCLRHEPRYANEASSPRADASRSQETPASSHADDALTGAEWLIVEK
jgi:hypothetical protein